MIKYLKILFHQNSKIRPLDTKLYVGVSVAYMPKSRIHHYYHGVRVFEKIKDKSCNAQNRRSDESPNRLFDTYKNYATPNGNNMFHT